VVRSHFEVTLKIRISFVLFFIFPSSFYLACQAQGSALPSKKAPFAKTNARSNQACISCHKKQAKDWQQSDHHKSMAVAQPHTVKGNFNDQLVEHYGQKARFYKKDQQYLATLSYDNKQQTFPIKFTFGHFPLQQYLVNIGQGKLQVLPFAWDSRDKNEGGQRWYHNYSSEEIRPQDRLHWRQPLQNWNGMCADCHSDGLVRNYDINDDKFASQWDNINVGCLSCHGDMSAHSKQQTTQQETKHKTVETSQSISKPMGLWLRKLGESTAHWQGAARDNQFMDNCFACHSLRTPLTDGFKHDKAFLDQFSPKLLQAPMYYADGQIKDEVYVYGSFLQSKMYRAGVNCLDCHDSHTMKLKIDGNGLCLQCHSAETFNVESHHRHTENSTGAQCVNCHMPTNRYMGVDDRRDHSFKIPRPIISKQFNTPNPCLSCHTDKNNQWAENTLINWHGQPAEIKETKLNFMRLQNGGAISLSQHMAIIADSSLAVISRATALELLVLYGQVLDAKPISAYLTDNEGLIRMAAASVGHLFSFEDKLHYLTPLLGDKLKAVRIEAARALIEVNLAERSLKHFILAFKELMSANNVNSWRGEGRANIALVNMQQKEWLSAENNYQQAITIDRYFEQGYLNLAEFYRQTKRTEKSAEVLQLALKNLPKASGVHYAYGLHLVRAQQHKIAVDEFKLAHEISPEIAQYLYTYVLALDSVKQSKRGLAILLAQHSHFKHNKMIKELGTYLAQKLQDKNAFQLFTSH